MVLNFNFIHFIECLNNFVVEIEMIIEVEISLIHQGLETELIGENDHIEIIVKEIMIARLVILVLEKGKFLLFLISNYVLYSILGY